MTARLTDQTSEVQILVKQVMMHTTSEYK